MDQKQVGERARHCSQQQPLNKHFEILWDVLFFFLLVFLLPFYNTFLNLHLPSFRPEINASNLTFFLVMPVQRIARYPLLLQTIQKHTEPTHPAYETLTQAAHIAVQLNCRINEYKRFREVGEWAAIGLGPLAFKMLNTPSLL